MTSEQYDELGEIDLRELIVILWKGKHKILISILAFFCIGLIYVLLLPDKYTAEILLAPSQSESGGGGFASQYGSLASLAGINLSNTGGNRLEQVVEVMTSWPFIDAFVNKHKLKPLIIAAERWDKKSNTLIFDESIYDSLTDTWIVQDVEKNPEPSSFRVFKKFEKMLKVSLDSKSGFLTIELEYFSPVLAYEWINWLVQDINSHFQELDIASSRKNIEYLKQKVQETPITEMKTVFYNLIESQTKSLMLAEVGEQYLVKAIVPAMLPESKSAPKRVLLCILSGMIGGVFGFSWVLFSALFLRPKNH